jgi:N-acyl homoserine lactone hydrolase
MKEIYPNVTTTVKVNGKDVKVHALCTGTVAVKTAFKARKGRAGFDKLNMLLGKEFTPFLPIWVWVIEHPEGLIVIDTGENESIMDPGHYLSGEKWVDRYPFSKVARFQVRREDELDRQFDSVGLSLADVRLVVLTHLHLDHTDGLKFFPGSEVIVGEHEFRRPISNMASTYPSWFKPHLVEYSNDSVAVFEKAWPITSREDLLYIPTPGHTHGHSSVLFRTDSFDILFAGDISYDQGQVLKGEYAGVNADFGKARDTYGKLLDYARVRPLIYLPSHDQEAGQRLFQRSFMI